jgi:hypothetical protein
VCPALPPDFLGYLEAAQEAPASACVECAQLIRRKGIDGLRLAAHRKFLHLFKRAASQKDRLAAKALFQNALLKQHLYWTSLLEVSERMVDLLEFLPPGIFGVLRHRWLRSF